MKTLTRIVLLAAGIASAAIVATPAAAQTIPWMDKRELWIDYTGGIAIPAGYLTIQEEGVDLPAQGIINCVGAGIVCSDDAASFRTLITISAGGGGAPTTTDYLVGTTDAGLSAEIVVGTSPGGELGGTWASPTIDDGLTVTGWTSVNTDTSFNTKGDIVVATANNTAEALPVAANDTVLVADSATGTGLKWVTLPTASYTADSVTLAKIANAAANSVLVGSGSAGTGTNYTEITLGSGLTMTGTALSASGSGVVFDPTTKIHGTGFLFDDFLCGGGSSSTSVGSCFGNAAVNTNSGTSGVGISAATGVDTNTPGVAFLSTAASANGISALALGPSGSNGHRLLKDGDFIQVRLQLSDLSTTAEEFGIDFGIVGANVSTSTSPTKGAWFSYRNTTALATPNWAIHTFLTVGTPGGTDVDCAIVTAQDAWMTMKIQYIAASGVHFSINGTPCTGSPISTNIPTAAGDELKSWFLRISKFAGTATAAQVWVDYMWLNYADLTR